MWLGALGSDAPSSLWARRRSFLRADMMIASSGDEVVDREQPGRDTNRVSTRAARKVRMGAWKELRKGWKIK